MKCFFDENLPPRLARALNELECDSKIEVRPLRDAFTPSTTDREWITALRSSDEKCFIITKDRRIRKNLSEREAWKESKLQIVFMKKAWSGQALWDINWKLIRRWPEILERVKGTDSSFELPLSGKIQVV